MGTYTRIYLKKRSQAKKVNELIKGHGAEYETFNNVDYGPFYSKEMETEDIRFMNEDEEGLKQRPEIKRPITLKDFQKLKYWGYEEIGVYVVKISCPNEKEIKDIQAIKKFLNTDEAKKYIDFDNSEEIERLINL